MVSVAEISDPKNDFNLNLPRLHRQHRGGGHSGHRFGHLLESFVSQQLIALADCTDPDIRFWHRRDKDQVGVDCILSCGNKIWAAEIKTSRTVTATNRKGLHRLATLAGKDFQSGIVFHDGDNTLPITGTPLLAVPISKLWEL